MDVVVVEFLEQISEVIVESVGGYNYNDDCEKCLWWTDAGNFL